MSVAIFYNQAPLFLYFNSIFYYFSEYLIMLIFIMLSIILAIMKGDKQNKLLNYDLYKVIFMNNKKRTLKRGSFYLYINYL